MKKILPLSALTLFTLQAHAFDAPEDDISCISECNVQGVWQPKTASAGIECGFTVAASFLYQEGLMDGLRFTKNLTQNLANPQPGDKLIIADNQPDLDFKWEPGVRVNVGYTFAHWDQFNLDLTWTYLKGRGARAVSVDITEFSEHFLKPDWVPFLLGPNAADASSKWDCKLNVLDGTFGRKFFLGRWLTVHPYAGVRGAWIDQDYKVNYFSAWTIDTSGSGALGLSILNTEFDGKNDFTGAGMLFGLETDWYLTCQFSVFSNLKASLVYGKFDVNQVFDGQVVIPFSGIPTIVIPEEIQQSRKVHYLRPNIEGELGIHWEQFFCCDSYRLFVGLSYEMSFWFFQNLFENPTNVLDSLQNAYTTATVEARNLQFQGINLELGFDF